MTSTVSLFFYIFEPGLPACLQRQLEGFFLNKKWQNKKLNFYVPFRNQAATCQEEAAGEVEADVEAQCLLKDGA